MTKARRIPILVALVAGGLAIITLLLRGTAAAAPSTTRLYPSASCNARLQDCINASSSGDEIVIAAGTYITKVVMNQAISLTGANLATTILKALPGERVLLVTGTGVTPDTVISNLTIQGGVLTTTDGAGILVRAGAQPTLRNLIIQSGTVSAPTAVGGGLATESSLTLTNIIFSQNTAFAGHGGGLAGGPGAHLTLINVSFINNGADQGGGGLYADSATITGSTFSFNFAGVPGFGGGAYLSGTVTVTNTTFVRNEAHETGGGLFAGGNALVSGGEFRLNLSQDENGGALGVAGNLLLNGTVISANKSFDSGGAMLITGTTTLDNAFIANNQSTGGSGGGLRGNGVVRINNTQFISNSAQNPGGGLRGSVAIFLTDTTFISNTSGGGTSEGGGLRANAEAAIVRGSFIANNADVGGGAYVQGSLVLSGTTFTGNTAAVEGGGLRLNSGTVQNAAFDQNTVLVGKGGGLAANNILTLTRSVFTANQVLSGTQVNGDGTGGGVYGNGTINSTGNTFLRNFAHRLGGGMDADDLQSTANQFRGNLTGPQGSGGGLFVSGAFEIKNDQFFTNTASTGGGLGVNSSAIGSIVNSLFARNVVTFSDGGAAMRLLSTSTVVVMHNTLVGDSANNRAAIHMQSPSGDFSIFANIFTDFERGMVQFGSAPTSTATTDHNVFFSVTLPYIGNPAGYSVGASDITGTVNYRDATANDFHLLPGSVAIDHAPNNGVSSDVDDQARPAGPNFDSGFDEAYSASISLSKTDGQATVIAGGPVIYTLVVSNAGPDLADNLLVIDDLPPELLGATWICAAGAGSSCPANGVGSINAVITVDAASSVTFTINATLDSNAAGTLVNDASVAVPNSLINLNPAGENASDSSTILPGFADLYLPAVHN